MLVCVIMLIYINLSLIILEKRTDVWINTKTNSKTKNIYSFRSNSSAVPAGTFDEQVLGGAAPLIEGSTGNAADILEKSSVNSVSESTNAPRLTDSVSAGCNPAGIAGNS